MIKILHLLTKPNDERERRSQESIQQLKQFDNFKYQKNINCPYLYLPPKENCLRPQDIQEEPGYYKLTSKHYGCYLSHRDAVLNYWDNQTDAILICECDAIINVDINLFVEKVNQAYTFCLNENLILWTFGSDYGFHIEEKFNYWIINRFVEAHCYMILKKDIDFFKSIFNDKWDVTDLFYINYLKNKRLGIFKEILSLQASGMSLLDKKISTENTLGVKKL